MMVTPPKASKAVASSSMSAANMMTAPSLPLDATQPVQPSSLAEVPTDAKTIVESMEVDPAQQVQKVIDAVASQATLMEEEI